MRCNRRPSLRIQLKSKSPHLAVALFCQRVGRGITRTAGQVVKPSVVLQIFTVPRWLCFVSEFGRGITHATRQVVKPSVVLQVLPTSRWLRFVARLSGRNALGNRHEHDTSVKVSIDVSTKDQDRSASTIRIRIKIRNRMRMTNTMGMTDAKLRLTTHHSPDTRLSVVHCRRPLITQRARDLSQRAECAGCQLRRR
jgi:hypothetical protein